VFVIGCLALTGALYRIVGMTYSAPARTPLGPAGGDGFEAGVETDPLHAMHRHVAEQGALPATEAMESHRHRDRHIDANHADLNTVCEFARGVTVAREDRDPVAVFRDR